MNLLYCHQCGEEREYTEKELSFNYEVRNLDFTIIGKLAYCKVCGEELFHPQYDRDNQKKAFDLYRTQEGILSPEQIKEIREKYGLTIRDYSRLLGFGEITIARYERGSLPTPAQNQIIKDSMNPNRMLDLIRENGGKVAPEVVEKLKQQLQAYTQEEEILHAIHDVFHHKPDIETGLKTFDMKKFSQMVLFFAEKEQPYLTKLNKQLFYSDFYFFKKWDVSISGVQYLRYDHGPVPNRYLTLFESIDEIEVRERVLNFGPCNYVAPTEIRNFDPSVFTKEELEILEIVYEKFKGYSAGDIREFSHQEAAWLETPMRKPISYEYAKKLDIERVYI